MMSLLAQQASWYSFPNGQGFHGTNMKPGHVNSLTHFDMLSSTQLIQDGMKFFPLFLFQQSNMYLTSQKRSRNDGGHVEAYFILLSMFSNLFHVMKQARQKGAPSRMSISCVDQKACQSDPSTVDMRTHKPIHRNNSP